MSELVEYAKLYAHFPFALRQIAKHPLTPGTAKARVRARLAAREENFLAGVERNMYSVPASPYNKLLKHAGCEFGDLQSSVRRNGLEATLRVLRSEGVYVSFEEFKGRKPIVRNGLALETHARDFDNPFAKLDIPAQTGGSTGNSTLIRQDLAYIGERAANEMTTLAAYGMLGAPTITWGYLIPVGKIHRTIQLACFGQPLLRYYVANGWRDAHGWLKYDAVTLYILVWMRLLGLQVPFPRTIRPAQANIIAQEIHDTVKVQHRCLVYTGIGRAMRIALAAKEARLDLTGTIFRGGGEPITAAKADILEQVGARFVPNYAMSEGGFVGAGCANPVNVSDVHLLRDLFALVTAPQKVEGFEDTVPALNLTSLLPNSPKVMLNYQVDDYGIVEERACGCGLEEYGYTTHIRDIYSYSKLVSEGVTLIGSEMLRILEQVLPARFGGTPLDYQLSELEDEQGFTRLHLIISPRVAIGDESQVIETFLAALRSASPSADAAQSVWRQSDTIRIKRQEPVLSARGKLLPLRIRTKSIKSSPDKEEQ